MTDMLVRLYDLPDLPPALERARAAGLEVRRGLPAEKRVVVDWVRERFSDYWASECDVAFHRQPVSCFLAIKEEALVGFACYDATYRDFFGPTGVAEAMRGQGIGTALLLACLHDMAAQGYAYAIIGWVGPADFYAWTVGAIEIPDSTPGIFRGILHDPGEA